MTDPDAVPSRDLVPDALPERARGRVGLKVGRIDSADRIADLRQEGCARLLFPARASAAPVEAVVVNTGGGLTGGDRFDVRVSVDHGASAVLTTQACEKVYRASAGTARVSTRLSIGRGASLLWAPQETILFDGSRLDRRLEADVANGGTLLAAEAVLLGRPAMGETLRCAAFRDSWRIRREGKLVFAEETRCDGRWADAFARRAALGEGAGAFATLVLAAPSAEGHLGPARGLMERHGIDGGASVVDALLVVRLVAGPGLALRKALLPLLELLAGQPAPRVWNT